MKLSDFLTRGNYTLEYGSLWSYSPYGIGEEDALSRSYTTAVKNDESIFVSGQEVPMIRHVAQKVHDSADALPFWSLFESNPALVPIPSSSEKQPDSLWVPLKIASALKGVGLGSVVSPCLKRIRGVPKAATSRSDERPSVAMLFDSLVVQKLIADPDSILLIDDVVTRGSAMVSSALRMSEAYPKAKIVGFATIRTVTDPENFRGIELPVSDKITLYPSGRTHREPPW